jgi:predicted PurR-regulated permease PerM
MKNKINYKLVNISLIVFIVYLMHKSSNLWMGIFKKIWSLSLPFVIAFVLAYALYPAVVYLRKKKVPKGGAIFIVIAGLLSLIGVIFFFSMPLLYRESISLFKNIMEFLNNISTNYDINLGGLESTLGNAFNEIINSLSTYVSTGAITFINESINIVGMSFIVLASAIYLLSDMEEIRATIRNYLKKKNEKEFNYVKTLDNELKAYLVAFTKIMFISLIEYIIVYSIVGHPNFLLLGLLAAVGNLIPFFGGIITNIVAAVTAAAISPVLFLKTCIAFAICSNIDGYVINPWVYGKSNSLKPILTIFAVFVGGSVGGFFGIVASLPITIIIMVTIKFYYDDITNKLGEMKRK